jgi:hypothetical protein
LKFFYLLAKLRSSRLRPTESEVDMALLEEGGAVIGRIIEEEGGAAAVRPLVEGGPGVELVPPQGGAAPQIELPDIPPNAPPAQVAQIANSTSFGARIWKIINSPAFMVGTFVASEVYNDVKASIDAASSGQRQCFSDYLAKVQANFKAKNLPWSPDLQAAITEGAAIKPDIDMTC